MNCIKDTFDATKRDSRAYLVIVPIEVVWREEKGNDSGRWWGKPCVPLSPFLPSPFGKKC